MKTLSAVMALFLCAQASASGEHLDLWTCKHLDDNTFPMNTYAYSLTPNCPPPPHSTRPWQLHKHDPTNPTKSVTNTFNKPGYILITPPEPECIIHSFPPTREDQPD